MGIKVVLFDLDSINKIKYTPGFLKFVAEIRPKYRTALVTSGRSIYTQRLDESISLFEQADFIAASFDEVERILVCLDA